MAQTLLSGLGIGESARWHDGRLWFAHWGTHDIVAVDDQGTTEVVAQGPGTMGVSIDWLPDGRLLITGDDDLVVREADGELAVYGEGLRDLATGWNEIVVDGR